uniref:Uncharacterized protein n=1 Tax=Pseudomonas phage HRDY3 TaxID=3236930 RepID=A0AB39CDQ5_9VIRU
MSEVKIAKEIPFADVTLGLTLLCGPADGKAPELDKIRAQLAQADHDTIFGVAFNLAQQNKRKLFGRDATYNEFLSDFDGRDALFLSLPGETPVIGAMCGGHMMAPNEKLSPDNYPDQKLFILTAIGIASAEPDSEDDEPYIEPESGTIH